MQSLIDKLRGVEAEALRLSILDITPDRRDAKKIYEERLHKLEACHSRSWFGDHTSTYYRNFEVPPAGRSFDVEWGFIVGLNGSNNSDWRTYSRDEIRQFVFANIGEDIFYEYNNLAEEIETSFSALRDQTLDVVELFSKKADSNIYERYAAKLKDEFVPYSIADYINGHLMSAPRMTRDSEQLSKGSVVPAHLQYLSSIQSVVVNKKKLIRFSSLIRNIIEISSFTHMEKEMSMTKPRIFIGHGRSEQWRVLKDFLNEKLKLNYDEFNRVSAAGLGTQERLKEMIDHCGFAFLVLTAEDVHDDQSAHARENVVHEAGLFQGRLGWRKAILLLEEGCSEFSNIVGLGQIRFPKGKISGCFEEVRAVLAREAVISE